MKFNWNIWYKQYHLEFTNFLLINLYLKYYGHMKNRHNNVAIFRMKIIWHVSWFWHAHYGISTKKSIQLMLNLLRFRWSMFANRPPLCQSRWTFQPLHVEPWKLFGVQKRCFLWTCKWGQSSGLAWMNFGVGIQFGTWSYMNFSHSCLRSKSIIH